MLLELTETMFLQTALYTFSVHKVDKVKLLQVRLEKLVVLSHVPQLTELIMNINDGQFFGGGTHLKVSSV